jgi:MutS domain V
MPKDPRETYHQLIHERRADVAALERRHRNLGYLRLGTVAAAAALVWIALASGAISIAWVLVPAALFAALLAVHDRLLRTTELRRRAVAYFERAQARIEDRWAGTGEAGERYLDPAHPYALDLDLFGKGSLFELLSTARTRTGADTLARWLLAPAEPAVARARQQAVEELRPRLDLREDLATLAEDARSGVDPEFLSAWGEMGAGGRGPGAGAVWGFTAIGIAGFAGLIALLLHAAGVTRAIPGAGEAFLAAILANGWFLHRYRGEAAQVVGEVEQAAGELQLLSDVLGRLEREQFQAPMLATLRAGLDVEGEPPSRRLRQLRRLIEYLDSRDNVLVRTLEVFILWTPHLAVKVEGWRRHSGPAVRRWLRAVGEIEALSSLASHAYENPDDIFPEIVEGTAPFLEADGIAHPLLPRDRAVRNDSRLGEPARVLVVSGSNMSGKSTMLRTLGVGCVLAQAGAPVRARRMLVAPLAVGASIRVSDSLQGGVSRFYAEILRLRQILDMTAGPRPVLFLIDEVLHGTNSHDRRIGAQAVVKELVTRGAIGLMTTHDLALAEIVDTLGERAANVHFEDHVEDGQIRFDYVMRPGVVRKSNAIELMRSVGLEI